MPLEFREEWVSGLVARVLGLNGLEPHATEAHLAQASVSVDASVWGDQYIFDVSPVEESPPLGGSERTTYTSFLRDSDGFSILALVLVKGGRVRAAELIREDGGDIFSVPDLGSLTLHE